MTYINDILFIIVVFIANAIQTITGFAGTVLAMPPSMLLIGVDEAKVVLNIVALVSCLWISILNFKYINFKELFKIVVIMFLGMIVGINLYKVLPLKFLLTIYGILIIIIALKNLIVKNKSTLPNIVMILILIASGIIHGMFVSGGALLVVYAAKVLKDKNEFRATIAPVWVLLNTVLMISDIRSGFFTADLFTLIAISCITLIFAMYVGNKLYKKIDQDGFLKLVYFLLIISGAMVII